MDHRGPDRRVSRSQLRSGPRTGSLPLGGVGAVYVGGWREGAPGWSALASRRLRRRRHASVESGAGEGGEHAAQVPEDRADGETMVPGLGRAALADAAPARAVHERASAAIFPWPD